MFSICFGSTDMRFGPRTKQTLIQPEDIERWVEIGKCDSGAWNYKFSQNNCCLCLGTDNFKAGAWDNKFATGGLKSPVPPLELVDKVPWEDQRVIRLCFAHVRLRPVGMFVPAVFRPYLASERSAMPSISVLSSRTTAGECCLWWMRHSPAWSFLFSSLFYKIYRLFL